MPQSASAASMCMRHINRIHRLMQFYEKCKTSFDNLTFLQMQLLLYVMENKAVSMKELASNFKVKPASMTPLIDRLVAKEMLQRLPDSHDRRITKVALTEKADLSLLKIFEEKTKGMEFMLSFLDANDQEALVRIMRTMDQGLTAHFESL